MKKALQGIALIILVALAIFATRKWLASYLDTETGNRAKPVPSSNSPTPRGASTSASDQNLPTSPPKSATEPDPVLPVRLPDAKGVSPSFIAFITEEADLLNSPHVDAAAAESRGKAQAKGMGDPEIRYARDLVLMRDAPANQRVAAAYTISLASAGGKDTPALAKARKDIALAAHASDRAEPHSLEEHKNSQAKAFSLMAIDAQAELATKNRAAREELKRWANEANDSTIRSYIEQKLRELSPL